MLAQTHEQCQLEGTMLLSVVIEPKFHEVMTGCGFTSRSLCNRAYNSGKCRRACANGSCPAEQSQDKLVCVARFVIDDNKRLIRAIPGTTFEINRPS
jgi:hypothetical protein